MYFLFDFLYIICSIVPGAASTHVPVLPVHIHAHVPVRYPVLIIDKLLCTYPVHVLLQVPPKKYFLTASVLFVQNLMCAFARLKRAHHLVPFPTSIHA